MDTFSECQEINPFAALMICLHLHAVLITCIMMMTVSISSNEDIINKEQDSLMHIRIVITGLRYKMLLLQTCWQTLQLKFCFRHKL